VTYPQPLPTVGKTQVIEDWIISLGWDVTPETGFPVSHGPEIIGSPDRLLTITPSPGPGWITEEAGLDTWGFQARLRGPSDDPDTPQLMSERLDVLILNAPRNVTVDGVLIKMVTRSGGTPTPLPLDPQERRFEYVCTYLITTGLE
jgi:hypothetical protein